VLGIPAVDKRGHARVKLVTAFTAKASSLEIPARGGTDLKIGRERNETRLTAPFMNRIKGWGGVTYFVSDSAAACVELQAQHLSNAGLDGPNQKYALNTPVAMPSPLSGFSLSARN